MKITLSSPGLHVVVGEQVNARRGGAKGRLLTAHGLPPALPPYDARRGGAKGRPQGSPPLHSTAPALTMSGKGLPTLSACGVLRELERELNPSSLTYSFSLASEGSAGT